jgi:alkylhydroperoxidase family enzyme
MKAILEDWRTAPMEPRLRATLGFLEKMTREPESLGPADVEAVRAAGVSQTALNDAIAVCFTFNVINRVADALGFAVPSDGQLAIQAPLILKRGYKF